MARSPPFIALVSSPINAVGVGLGEVADDAKVANTLGPIALGLKDGTAAAAADEVPEPLDVEGRSIRGLDVGVGLVAGRGASAVGGRGGAAAEAALPKCKGQR